MPPPELSPLVRRLPLSAPVPMAPPQTPIQALQSENSARYIIRQRYLTVPAHGPLCTFNISGSAKI